MNIWGRNLRLSIFGESHGEAIGIVMDGLPPGFPMDMDYVNFHMARRAPGQSELTTPRKES
ncbi:MAG TPA: chorismate synthase, partial [Bacillota bacterium]|nr:chorismate synthase [Bacillota bacterium]